MNLPRYTWPAFLLAVGVLCLAQSASAVTPAVAAWTGRIVEGGLTDFVGHVLSRFYDDHINLETVYEAQNQVAALAVAVEEAKQDPSPEVSPSELETIKEQLNRLQTVLDALSGQEADQQRQVADELAALRAFVEAQGKTAPRPPLGVEAAFLVRDQGRGEMRPLFNGGSMRTGDHYKVVFTPREDGYVYVFQTDSSGKVYRLFPMAEMKGVRVDHFNPVKAGTTYTLPAADKSFLLDDQRGPETFYLIASKQRDPELEAAFESQEAAPAGASRRIASAELERTIKARGPAGIVRDPKVEVQQVDWEDGQAASVTPGLLEGRCGAPGGCVHTLQFEHL